MPIKTCKKCNEPKILSEFSSNKFVKDGRQSWCRICTRIANDKYLRTKRGVVAKIYTGQKVNSKRRKYKQPEYNLNELFEWAISQQIFKLLYDDWVKSNYDKMHVPSFDRLDDYKSYTLDNLQITTWKKNKDKGHEDRKNGVNNKVSKEVIKMTKSGEFISSYPSANYASRVNMMHRQNISDCCTGKQKTSGGFRWMYSLGILINNNIGDTTCQ